MRFNKHKHAASLDMNMTPMIDVTFLLIIFFMTASQISAVNKEQIELPPQKGSQEQSEGALIINVNESGEIIVGGNSVTETQLVPLVAAEIANQGNDPLRVKVTLRADLRSTARPVNQVLTVLEKLGVNAVNLGTKDPRP